MTQIIEAPFTQAQKQEAERLGQEIQTLVDSITNMERSLAQDWVTLGRALFEARESKYWILWGYESFGRYIAEIGDKVNKGRSRLYQSIGVVEKLPAVSDEDLKTMGISKATELSRLSAAGKQVPRELIDRALKPETTIQDVRAEVFDELNLDAGENGKFWDMRGFYVTAEERKEIEETFDLAARIDPVVPKEWSDSARLKEIVLRLIREFRTTYEPAVARGEI